MFHTRGQATTQTPTTGAPATGRLRSILLVLALLAALGAPLAAAAPVGAQAAVRLELTPAMALTDVKKPVRYTAELVDANDRSDVTSRTTLQATGPAPCHQDHDKLSCDDNGSFEVIGILYDPEITSEPVVLEVVNPGVAPTLGPPPPDSPPNREVRVRGHTGSCNQDGTLSSTELKVNQQVTGIFTATIRIPSGTFPGSYPLSLDVPCDGKPQGATVQITVSNRPPDAVNDVGRATPGRSVRIPVTDNDTDPDGEDGYKSALEADPPTVGTADPAGQVIVYTPGPGFVDRDQFTYRNCDVVDAAGKTDCGQATVVVTREDPVPKADQAGTKQGKEVPILVTENDTSPDPAKLRVRTGPKHGTAVVKEPRDGHIVYTPEDGFADEDTFEYDYCEGVVGPNVAALDACPFATVTVTVEPGPPEPEAVDDPNERTERDKQVDIDVMSNDGHPVAARLQVLPEPAPKGTAVPLPNGMIRYTPEPGATGKDSFQYDYCKPVINLTARAACAPATVTVVIRPPVEITKVDPNPTPPNREVVVEGTTGFCQEGTLTLRIPPDKDVPAAVTANRDGAFTARLKVPGGTFVGPYGLVLRVDCDGQAQEAQEKLVVANRPPDAVDDLASTPRDTPVTIPVTGNDTDPDGDDGYKTSLEATQPANGRTVAQPDNRVLYTPNGGFTGDDPFTYRFCDIVTADGRKDCDTATVTVTVLGRQQPVPVDDPDETAPRDQPVVIEVMKNDRDPDASLLQVKPPARPGAKAEEQPGGTVRYTPEAGFTGTDTFTYDYCGGSVDVTAARAACPSATVTVSVTSPPVISSVEPGSTSAGKPVQVLGNTGSCSRAGTLALQGTGAAVTVAAGQDGAFTTSLTVPAGTFPGPYTLELRVDCKGQLQRAEGLLTVTNHAPVAVDDVASTTRDQPVRIRVTDNDRDPDDPDGYRALVLVTRQPDHGAAEPQPDQTVVYTPQRGFVGTDRFTYSLCDDVLNAAGRADCGTATVTVTVTDTPVISSVEPASTSPGKPVRVVGNTGSCSRAGTLTFSGAANLRMNVTGDQNGGFAATITVPEGTFPRPYRLRLDVDCKGQVQRAEAELTVANQAPVAVDDEVTVSPDTPTSIDVTGNDRDPDDPDTYRTIVVVTRLPDQGAAKEGPDQSIVYTPGEGFVGTDSFEYSLCDDVLNAAGQADCGAATVTVRVDPIPCVPSERDNSSLRVEPERGSGGTRLRITAAVDRRLATCQLRLLLGGTPLAPDVNVGDDGRISAERGVPPGLKPGPNLMRLAAMTAETLAEAPFEVVGPPPPPPPPPPWPARLLLGGGALAAGFLARAAFRRWGKPGEDGNEDTDRPVEQPDDIRAKPHNRPVEVTVEPVPDNTRTLAVRLEPHPDPGIQTIQTQEEVTP